MIASVLSVLVANRTAWRRARNLRAAHRRPRLRLQWPDALGWLSLAGCALGVLGTAVLVMHARLLDRVVASQQAGPDMGELRRVLPGVAFDVPARPGVEVAAYPAGALLIMAGMTPQVTVRIDLCTQLLDPGRPRLLPLRIGLPFAEVARLATQNAAAGSPATLRNIVMAESGSALPHIEIGGAAAGAPLAVRWSQAAPATRWISDASGGQVVAGVTGQTSFTEQGWLVFGDGEALRVLRRASPNCPQAGELLLQRFRIGGDRGLASVSAFGAQGASATVRLVPGHYTVPVAAPTDQEDGELFAALRHHGLLRLDKDGLAQLAPKDLAAWRGAAPTLRATSLDGWDGPPLDDAAKRLLERVYQKADGDFLREQVRIFNAERRLLALRARAVPAGAVWQAAPVSPVEVSEGMPAGAARLFKEMPQGWGAWSRIAGPAGASTVTLALPHAASGGESIELMLAGRLRAVRGAVLRQREDACDGRACPSHAAVQRLVLQPQPGVRQVALDAEPIDAAGLADPRYRYLDVVKGQLVWHQPPRSLAPGAGAAAQVTLADRHGTPLWTGGHPTEAARSAGLAPLVGIQPGHAGSVAGMLARLASPTGRHTGRLTLDLPLQATAQAALECIGMRRGRWDGHACTGGGATPPGRQAGLVLLDAETGDILAAAGAGMPRVDASNWAEVRDFDAADPAASPLRLPAFQHDGGRDRSPGSTFKIISALGLEEAARHVAQLDAMLGGLPLDALDGIARQRGFAFRTSAAAYPADTRRAHVTNYREQSLGRRAQEGRLGIEQALTYSINTWFAWTAELSDRTLFGEPAGGVPDLQSLDAAELRNVRPILDMANRLGFGQPLRLDGGLLPASYRWSPWDALQATPANIDPIHSRHELRQMAIGLRMQATPLQMALAAGAVGQGRVIQPRLLAELDGAVPAPGAGEAIGVRLDRIRAGMKGVIDRGTAAAVFRGARFDRLRPALYGKTGTAPTGERDASGHELATVWFAGWLESGAVPGYPHRLAFAAFASRSEATGGEHAAPVVAAVLDSLVAH
ncbi:MAG: penicillin-binding transpeptidase domain-containing protein [Telluria sp.]